MYELSLTTSHAPAQSDMETRDITIGALLREVAAARRDAEALVEIRQTDQRGDVGPIPNCCPMLNGWP